MKLLVIPSWYSNTAANYDGIFIREQVKALKHHGLDIAVLFGDYQYRNYLSKSKRSFYIESDIPTFAGTGFFVPKANKYLIEKWARLHFPLFEDYVDKFGQADLIHAHSYMAGAIALQIKKAYGIPYVLSEHLFRFLTEDVRQRHQNLVREVYDGAEQLIAVSSALKTKMTSYSNTKITVIPNLVDTQKFKPAALPSLKPTKIFISVGNLNPFKGYDLLLNAFNAFKAFSLQTQENTILKIIGDGVLKEKLERQIKELNLEQSVFLLGALSQAKIITELQNASCFVSSSRVETFGVAIVEALAVGLPVIATKCGGPEEIVQAEVGQLVATNNESALTKAMLELDLSKYDANKISTYTEARFSKKVIANQLISFYKTVIDKT